jgi:hypothetical protein
MAAGHRGGPQQEYEGVLLQRHSAHGGVAQGDGQARRGRRVGLGPGRQQGRRRRPVREAACVARRAAADGVP